MASLTVNKSGAWFTYEGERLGQGREEAIFPYGQSRTYGRDRRQSTSCLWLVFDEDSGWHPLQRKISLNNVRDFLDNELPQRNKQFWSGKVQGKDYSLRKLKLRNREFFVPPTVARALE